MLRYLCGLCLGSQKRRRSWSDSDSSSSIPPVCKRVEPPRCGGGSGSSEEESVIPKHGADLCTSSKVSPDKRKLRGGLPPLIIAPPSVGSYTDTQDSFISSTTPTSHAPNTPLHPELLPPGSGSQQDAVKSGEVRGSKGKATGECNQYSTEAELTKNAHHSLLCSSQNT